MSLRARLNKLLFMPTITLQAHYDGQHILLDEPFDLPNGSKLMVTILPPSAQNDRAAWAQTAATNLARAYADDEPEYSVADVKS